MSLTEFYLVTGTFITMNTHTVVYSDSILHTVSCQWIKHVHTECTVRSMEKSCLFSTKIFIFTFYTTLIPSLYNISQLQ